MFDILLFTVFAIYHMLIHPTMTSMLSMKGATVCLLTLCLPPFFQYVQLHVHPCHGAVDRYHRFRTPAFKSFIDLLMIL